MGDPAKMSNACSENIHSLITPKMSAAIQETYARERPLVGFEYADERSTNQAGLSILGQA